MNVALKNQKTEASTVSSKHVSFGLIVETNRQTRDKVDESAKPIVEERQIQKVDESVFFPRRKLVGNDFVAWNNARVSSKLALRDGLWRPHDKWVSRGLQLAQEHGSVSSSLKEQVAFAWCRLHRRASSFTKIKNITLGKHLQHVTEKNINKISCNENAMTRLRWDLQNLRDLNDFLDKNKYNYSKIFFVWIPRSRGPFQLFPSLWSDPCLSGGSWFGHKKRPRLAFFSMIQVISFFSVVCNLDQKECEDLFVGYIWGRVGRLPQKREFFAFHHENIGCLMFENLQTILDVDSPNLPPDVIGGLLADERSNAKKLVKALARLESLEMDFEAHPNDCAPKLNYRSLFASKNESENDG